MLHGDVRDGLLAALYLTGAVLLIALAMLYSPAAQAHDEMTAENPDQARVYRFYSEWQRPKGEFNIEHRKPSCCNRSDCFPVAETKINDRGNYVVRPEGHAGWYEVNPSIIESRQEDPRESPDGRSHVCIIGEVAACFVEGGGI